MNTEKTRLDTMLRDKKISQDEYQILAAALKRKSFFAKMESSLLLNPFQKIAGFKALMFGMIILLLTSYLGVKAGLYYLGPLSAINVLAVTKQSIGQPFLLLLFQNTVCWLAVAIVFMIVAKILQKKKVRLIDFLGTVALARFPMLFITLYTYFVRTFYPSMLDIDLSKGLPIHASMSQYLFSICVTVLMVWQIVTYFYAFKESSGLLGKKLWWAFLGSLVLVQFLSEPITTLFMN
ncbi:MAG: hypothetical protein WC627_07190 [Legionella sp.]|jgi:hypothetical protein